MERERKRNRRKMNEFMIRDSEKNFLETTSTLMSKIGFNVYDVFFPKIWFDMNECFYPVKFPFVKMSFVNKTCL